MINFNYLDRRSVPISLIKQVYQPIVSFQVSKSSWKGHPIDLIERTDWKINMVEQAVGKW